MDNFPAVVLGLDVSKAKVDCALLSAGKLRSKVDLSVFSWARRLIN